jgi:hypothetical protein
MGVASEDTPEASRGVDPDGSIEVTATTRLRAFLALAVLTLGTIAIESALFTVITPACRPPGRILAAVNLIVYLGSPVLDVVATIAIIRAVGYRGTVGRWIAAALVGAGVAAIAYVGTLIVVIRATPFGCPIK